MGLLIFNVFLTDIFLLITNTNICNYADDNNTLYAINKNLHTVTCNLYANFAIVQKWFYKNHIVLNPRKCHMLIGNNHKPNKHCTKNDRKLRIWSHLLKKSLMENFIFRAVKVNLNGTGIKSSNIRNSLTCPLIKKTKLLNST